MLPGGGAFLERLDRNGLMGVVGDGEENSDSSDWELLLLLEGDGGATISPSMLYAAERDVRFMVLVLMSVSAVSEGVTIESFVVRRCDEDLVGSGAMFRARTGSMDGITAAARATCRASLLASYKCRKNAISNPCEVAWPL